MTEKSSRPPSLRFLVPDLFYDTLRRTRLRTSLLALLVALYLAWAIRFIAASAIETSHGRFFCLFDDAMISLRYGWNLAHGAGLVWNQGERVEGTTSFLSAIYMSLGALFLDKSGTALFMQITGIPLVIGVALMARQVGRSIDLTGHVGLISAAAVLAYYPLSYWSLLGMETGILAALAAAALLLALRLGSKPQGSKLLGLLLGLMVATRPDAAAPAAVILAFRAAFLLSYHRSLRALRPWLVELAGFVGIAGGLTLFRFFYYGSSVPNTYQLKMVDWPLDSRLSNGWDYFLRFFESSRYLLFLAFLSVVFRRDRRRLLLFCFAACILACQIWVGGDVWFYWRMLVPAVVVIIVLAVDGSSSLVHWVVRPERRSLILMLSAACSWGALWAADGPFLAELQMQVPPTYTQDFNRITVEAGVELAQYAVPQASVAAAAAGAVVYYSGLRGIDVLGKSDPHIARMKPDLTLGLGGQKTTPGHNKYDLHYSIETLRPDAIFFDAIRWGHDDVSAFVHGNYVRRGSWWLLRDSPYVHWDTLTPD